MNNSYWSLSVLADVVDYELKTWFEEEYILAVFKEKPTVQHLSQVLFNTSVEDEKVKAKDIEDIGNLIREGTVKSTIGRELHREREQTYILKQNMFD